MRIPILNPLNLILSLLSLNITFQKLYGMEYTTRIAMYLKNLLSRQALPAGRKMWHYQTSHFLQAPRPEGFSFFKRPLPEITSVIPASMSRSTSDAGILIALFPIREKRILRRFLTEGEEMRLKGVILPAHFRLVRFAILRSPTRGTILPRMVKYRSEEQGLDHPALQTWGHAPCPSFL